MDSFKIEEFEKDNPGRKFPRFETLRPEETMRIRLALAARLAASADQAKLAPNPFQLSVMLLREARSLDNVDIDAPDFSLYSVLASLGIKPTQHGYIEWGRFDDVDRFEFNDLSTYFGPICTDYLGDDTCVFDDTLDWLLFIMHFERVHVVIFDP